MVGLAELKELFPPKSFYASDNKVHHGMQGLYLSLICGFIEVQVTQKQCSLSCTVTELTKK